VRCQALRSSVLRDAVVRRAAALGACERRLHAQIGRAHGARRTVRRAARTRRSVHRSGAGSAFTPSECVDTVIAAWPHHVQDLARSRRRRGGR
jgi:hypothetical protein